MIENTYYRWIMQSNCGSEFLSSNPVCRDGITRNPFVKITNCFPNYIYYQDSEGKKVSLNDATKPIANFLHKELQERLYRV